MYLIHIRKLVRKIVQEKRRVSPTPNKKSSENLQEKVNINSIKALLLKKIPVNSCDLHQSWLANQIRFQQDWMRSRIQTLCLSGTN